MHVVIAGGVFRLSPQEMDRRHATPEINLARGLRQRGIGVTTLPLEAVMQIALPRNASVIHVHHLSKAALAAALSPACRPLVFTPHQTGLPDRASRRAGLRQAIRFADATVCLSARERDERALLMPRSVSKLHIIPNGMTFPSAPPRRRELGDGQRLRVLFVGQLIPMKRVDRLIRAVKVLPRMQLRIAYHNSELAFDLRQLAAELGVSDRVTFLGQLDPARLQVEYEAAHVLALPSEHAEGLPSVLTEALSTGLPAVASDIGGSSAQIGAAGLLLDPHSDSAPASALAKLIERYVEFAGEAAHRAAAIRSDYSLDVMVDRHVALYESVVRGR